MEGIYKVKICRKKQLTDFTAHRGHLQGKNINCHIELSSNFKCKQNTKVFLDSTEMLGDLNLENNSWMKVLSSFNKETTYKPG